jgi:hypothetical protein
MFCVGSTVGVGTVGLSQTSGPQCPHCQSLGRCRLHGFRSYSLSLHFFRSMFIFSFPCFCSEIIFIVLSFPISLLLAFSLHLPFCNHFVSHYLFPQFLCSILILCFPSHFPNSSFRLYFLLWFFFTSVLSSLFLFFPFLLYFFLPSSFYYFFPYFRKCVFSFFHLCSRFHTT